MRGSTVWSFEWDWRRAWKAFLRGGQCGKTGLKSRNLAPSGQFSAHGVPKRWNILKSYSISDVPASSTLPPMIISEKMHPIDHMSTPSE